MWSFRVAVLAALALAGAASAAAGPKPGARCARPGAVARAGAITVSCVGRKGKAVWRVARTARKPAPPSGAGGAGTAPVPAGPLWTTDANGSWRAQGPPPACPSPLFAAPADLGLASSILYPGQTRGTYKAHGGIRFDGVASGQVTVRAPADGYLVQGTRYLVDGQVQYGLDFVVPCGWAFRLGHLRVLTAEFQKVAETFPAPQENDSRTTFVSPPLFVKAGTPLATVVGLPGNVFFDFGVYDIRQPNAISANPAWSAQHPQRQWDWYGVCWLDLFAGARALPPGDAAAGRQSDYCA